MRPLLRLALPALLLIAPLGSRADDPPKTALDELTKKIQTDSSARAEAGKSLEEFLLDSSDGKSFVAVDTDRAALGAVARRWAGEAPADQLALLVLVATPNTPPLRRLRDALVAWTEASQIKAKQEKEAAYAFFLDASRKASSVYGEQRTRDEIDAAITTNDGAGVAARDRASIERARQLSSRTRVNTRAFGAGANPGSIGAGGTGTGGTGSGGHAGVGQGGQNQTQSVPGGGVLPGGGATTVGTRTNDQVSGVAGVQAGSGAYLPAANLPANFRRKSVSDVPSPTGSGVAVTPGVGAGSNPVDTSTKTAGGPADDGSAKIRAVFHETVARLVREGKRGAGDGTANGVMNNVRAMWDSKRLRCYDQAEELQADLEKKVGSGKNGWTYKMTSYTGEGHEANGHWWINAVHKDPKVHTMLLDPWSGEIKTDPSKEPVVIKGYFGWYFGAVMDKVMN